VPGVIRENARMRGMIDIIERVFGFASALQH